MKIRLFIKELWHFIKVILVFGFIIVEEIAWKKLGEPISNVISKLKIMERFKDYVNTVENRYMLLLIFSSVFVLMELTSTYGLILIGTGAIVTGIGMYSLKLFLTIPAVVIWKAGKKPLLSFIVIKFVFGLIIKLRRSALFTKSKNQLKKVLKGFKRFKEDYLNGNGEVGFIDSIKIIYHDLRDVK